MRMPVLKHAKYEAFARALAKGKDVMEAYAAAGYAPPHRQMALRLARQEAISARTQELQNEALWGGSRDVSVVINALMKLAEGEATTAAMVAAKRSCLVEAAKLKAMLPDLSQPQVVFTPAPQLSQEEWIAKYGR
jgi:hypothetical protein